MPNDTMVDILVQRVVSKVNKTTPMRQVIGMGETILDILFENDQPQTAVPGGSVFNSLVSLGRTQANVAFISELGDDNVGHVIRRFMDKNHISTQYIDTTPKAKSPISLAFLDSKGDAHYSFYKDYTHQNLKTTLPEIHPNDIVIFGSYYALNPALRQRTKEIIEYAKEKEAIIYYDPNFRDAHANELSQLLPSIIENLNDADIVRGSEEDFYNIFALTDQQKIYKEHIKPRCPLFITTLGAKGALLQTPTFSQLVEGKSIEVKSTIGAGDNFNAGLIYGLLKQSIKKQDLPSLDPKEWKRLINHGIDFSANVCQNYNNYISLSFVKNYIK